MQALSRNRSFQEKQMLVFVVLEWDDQSLSTAKDSVVKSLLRLLYILPALSLPPHPRPLPPPAIRFRPKSQTAKK